MIAEPVSRWILSHRADRTAGALADRHYSRQTPGAVQFVAPGHVLVFRIGRVAVWVSRWTEYPKHAWPGAWECPMFRNEGAGLSSDLIVAALAATVGIWGPPPAEGMITFVDPKKVRRKRDPGRCFRRAGFKPIACTLSGLLVLHLPPTDFPLADLPIGSQLTLGGVE